MNCENVFTSKLINMDAATSKIKLNEKKAKLKQKFAILTEDDLLFEEAREEEKALKYQAMFFQSVEELERVLKSLQYLKK